MPKKTTSDPIARTCKLQVKIAIMELKSILPLIDKGSGDATIRRHIPEVLSSVSGRLRTTSTLLGGQND